MKLTDFGAAARVKNPPRPDPGRAADPAADRPGACAAPAPRLTSTRSQEPGVIAPGPVNRRSTAKSRALETADAPQSLVSLAQTAKHLGIAKSTLADWVTDGLVPPGHHPAPGNRPGKYYNSDELLAMERIFSRFSVICRMKNGRLSRTNVRPDDPDMTRELITAFNLIYAQQATDNQANIQQWPGDSMRAVLLPEVPVAYLPGDQQVIRAEQAAPEPPSRMSDIRLWNRPGTPQPSAGRGRRPRRQRWYRAGEF